ncbi:MAG: hypothetical protein OEW36_10645 [Hylemonella sp.]|nr:hypothetical protein [Hylemonella sp.]
MNPETLPTNIQFQHVLPLFLFMVMGAMVLLSIVSGWRGLASRFPSVAVGEGQRFRFVSAKMGRVRWFPVNYGGSMILTVTPQGLAISTYMPFRFFFPAFFLPWAQVERVEVRASALARRTVVHIRGSSTWISFRGIPGQSVLDTYERVRSESAS